MSTKQKKNDLSNDSSDYLVVGSSVSITDPQVSVISERIGLYAYNLRILQALRQIIRAVDLHSRYLLVEHKITGPQLITLMTVEEQGPVTASAIAKYIHLSPSTVIGILDRLEAKGLIRRERDLKDRRLVWVSLTEKGKVLTENAPSPLQDSLAEAVNKLPDTELEMIVESLERIVELMKTHEIVAVPTLDTMIIDPEIEGTD